MNTLEEFPKYCDILATVTNADGETLTVEMGTERGTRPAVLAKIRGKHWQAAFRPTALDMAADAGLTLHNRMRVSWDARQCQ